MKTNLSSITHDYMCVCARARWLQLHNLEIYDSFLKYRCISKICFYCVPLLSSLGNKCDFYAIENLPGILRGHLKVKLTCSCNDFEDFVEFQARQKFD